MAVGFLEAKDPVKKPGPGDHADPIVAAHLSDPFRKVIYPYLPSGAPPAQELD